MLLARFDARLLMRKSEHVNYLMEFELAADITPDPPAATQRLPREVLMCV